jgi:uncharacterized membrane protein (DUF4010 family)
MKFRNRFNRRQALVPGLILLAVANTGSYLLRRSGNYSESVVDGVSGLLMGIAIAVMLLGIYASGRGWKGCGPGMNQNSV